MDKWRRVAHNLPKEYIFVNIPGYEAYVVNSDTLVETHRVVVGKPANKTPEIISRINIVVINPDWSVPYSIIKNEMRGKSHSYLSKYNIYQNGERVSPGNIRWGQNIRMVQPPGANNALGYIKFLFPNSHSVYLHDTPSRSLFSNSVRAYSHGCVRVQNPLDLGIYLLRRDSIAMTMDSMQALIKEGNTTNVKLKNTMPVFILYFTAHASNDGVLELYPDIYKKEEKDISVLFYGHYKKPADYKKGKKAIPSMQVKPDVKEESEDDPEIIAGVLGEWRKYGLI
jgi:murein L,D-transpeptidase YcbB/YkuD